MLRPAKEGISSMAVMSETTVKTVGAIFTKAAPIIYFYKTLADFLLYPHLIMAESSSEQMPRGPSLEPLPIN
jgi:hypothetical protein